MLTRSRLAYLALLGLTIAAGLSTRHFRGTPAAPVASGLGDGLWTVAVYLGYGLVFPRARPLALFALAAGTSTAVELSQLYHSPWIDAVRRTTPGGLVLGYGFDPADLACYYAAAAACLAAEILFVWSRTAAQPPPPA